MQFKKTNLRPLLILYYPRPLKLSLIVFLVFVFGSARTFSQSTYLSQGDKQNTILERLEIKSQNDSILIFSKTRYYNRSKYVVNGVRNYLHNWGDTLGSSELHAQERVWILTHDFPVLEKIGWGARPMQRWHGNWLTLYVNTKNNHPWLDLVKDVRVY